MGSKTLFNGERGNNDHSPIPTSNISGGEPKGQHTSRDGDGCVGSQGASADDDDGDDEDSHKITTATPDSLTYLETGPDTTNKKKRRKRSKKKTKSSTLQQTSPPRIPIRELFPSGFYPIGELLNYRKERETGKKYTAADTASGSLLEDTIFLEDYRRAAEVHRQTRHWLQESVKPGQTLTEIATGIEDSVRALLESPGMEHGQSLRAGMGFPTGLSINNCVAHYTPNPGQKEVVLQPEDVMKVDFGVHINGWIVDSAFTMSFDPTYDNLLAAVKDATNTGISNAGIDVRISDVSASIVEAMESYEVEICGKTYPVRTVRNLCGHDIKHYRIHGTKTVPLVRNSDQTKMEAGDIFAIETFGTTGRGYTRDDDGIYGYGLGQYAPKRIDVPLNSAKRLYRTIKENFGSLVFCRRYLERLQVDHYIAGLNCLVSNGILESYSPLVELPGSYSAQFEHTILLRDSQKEVISRGYDY